MAMKYFGEDGLAGVSINDIDLSSFNAKLLNSYEIGGPSIEASYFHGKSRSTFISNGKSVGLRTIKLPVDFCGDGREGTESDMARFNALLCGLDMKPYNPNQIFRPSGHKMYWNETLSELFTLNVGDGFWYECTLVSIGAPSWLNQEYCTVDYEMVGVKQSDAMQVTFAHHAVTPTWSINVIDHDGNSLYEAGQVDNPSTVPKTDVILTTTIPDDVYGAATAATKICLYRLTIYSADSEQITYQQDAEPYWSLEIAWDKDKAKTGDLVIDGVNKTITFAGELLHDKITWNDYPYLCPGISELRVYNSDGIEAFSTDNVASFKPVYL